MPVAFLIIGALFLVTAVRGNVTDLTKLLKDDFSGPNGFFAWAVGIGMVAAIGYIPGESSKKISNAFLLLIFLVLFIGKKSKDGKDIVSSFYSQLTGK